MGWLTFSHWAWYDWWQVVATLGRGCQMLVRQDSMPGSLHGVTNGLLGFFPKLRVQEGWMFPDDRGMLREDISGSSYLLANTGSGKD